jgi:hypothetical protein
VKPYYDEDGITIYCADVRECFAGVMAAATVMVTDPPFGFEYESNRPRVKGNAASIKGDRGTFLRDFVLSYWDDRPSLVFGSHKATRPYGVRQTLIWDQGDALGMGDLTIPWKHSWQEVYVIGGPWQGSRDCGGVLRCPPVQSMGRRHPNEKPVDLIVALLGKCVGGAVIDPFCGSGATLEAAKREGRPAIGIDVEERYCEVSAVRCSQRVLPFSHSLEAAAETVSRVEGISVEQAKKEMR